MNIKLLLILSILTTVNAYGQSVLNKQGLIKIATVKEGVYKIDREFLQNNSIDANKVDPHTIQVYGMPGGHVPQANQVEYPIDPQAIPMQIEANENSVFEENEAIFFYADPVENILFNFEPETYEYSNNLYADSLYFFIDLNREEPGRKMVVADNTDNGNILINWYEEVFVHELDEVNILRSGREWFGESFNITKTRDFNFSFTNELAENKPIHLRTNYMAQTYEAASLSVSANNFSLASLNLPTVRDFSVSPYSQKGHIVSETNTISTSLIAGSDITVRLAHQSSGTGKSEGYLDNLFLTVPQKLQYANRQIILRNREFQNEGSYNVEIQNISDQYVWDVSDPLNSKIVPHSSGDFFFGKQQGEEIETKFAVFAWEDAYTPFFVGAIDQQDLKSNSTPDFLIITTAAFKGAAENLARHRRRFNNFEVVVADKKEIFNEFAAGRSDISAIRNYIKFLYDLEPGKLKYVLMLGAASYDYKDRIANNSNHIPTYQSRNSLHPVLTYSSDDFYGFMENHEGEWSETSENGDLELGVGRIPCKTLEEAQNVVDKIIAYEQDETFLKKWRNEIYFVADDGDGNLHHRDSERLSGFVADNFKDFNIKKLYLGAFEQDALASTERSPKMRKALNEMMEKGALIVNYTGHGSESSWADESILTREMINLWSNKASLPLFVTATCEFGRHDNPIITSGAQNLILKKKGGAIGLLTTARPVQASSNYKINEAFYNSVFTRAGEAPKKLGDIMKETKNKGVDQVNNRNFILLGDPALTLAEPWNKVQVKEIVSVEGDVDTLKSMSKVSVSGEIISFQNHQLPDFDGVLVAELFDKSSKEKTFERNQTVLEFERKESVLYRGQASITNGEFSFTFYMPKNLNYQVDKGKFSFYAYSSEGIDDASGYYDEFNIGGSNILNTNDDIGPDIELFMDDVNFRNKDKVGSDAALLVHLFDEHGISISTGELDNGIVFSLDEEPETELNDYFYYDIDSYQSGEIIYNLTELSPGWHDLTVQAKDVFNNASHQTIEFFVVGNEKLEILNFMVYPNPAKDFANFRIEQNRKEQPVEVVYNIIDSNGKLIHEQSFLTSDQKRNDSWDLRNREGIKVAPGLYFIRIFLRSVEDQSKTQQIKKLIVIN